MHLTAQSKINAARGLKFSITFEAIQSNRAAILGQAVMEPHGLYRERNGWGTQHSVRVKYDEHQELDMAEDRYRARGYQPPFDQLPWKDEGANDNP